MLVPGLLGSFFLDFTHNVVVETVQLDEHFLPGLLHHAQTMAKHSSVVHIRKGDTPDGLPKSLKYVWGQKQMQPWGKPLPAQCPHCRAFRSWGPRKNIEEGGGKVAKFYCRGQLNRVACKYVFVAPMPSNLIHTTGDWLTVIWPSSGENVI